jgi:O-methyltransferase
MKNIATELPDQIKQIILSIADKKYSLGSLENLSATSLACRHVVLNNIPGDFVECGVWRAGQSIVAAKTLQFFHSDKRLWLYDTFEGMTAPSQYDVDYLGRVAENKEGSKCRTIQNDWVYADLEEAKRNINEFNVDAKLLSFIVGDLSKTLTEKDQIPEKISILRLDTDWYESTKKELEVLYPLLSPGGILIIDDYGHWGGSKKAVDEYFNNSKLLIPIDYTSRITIK